MDFRFKKLYLTSQGQEFELTSVLNSAESQELQLVAVSPPVQVLHV